MNVKGSPKKAMRFLSLLLAASLFLGTQGFTVFAQTISENGAVAAGSGEQENEGKGGSSQTEPEAGNTGTEEENAEAGSTYPQDSDNPDPQWEALPDSNVSENNARVGAGSPANPIHHCNTEDGTQDTTTWSYVYFGSYPQSKVTDEATKQAIDSAISQGKGQLAGTAESSEGTDVWVNGTKYRRISKIDTNYSGYFDYVSNNGYRYFKWERIKWRVLQNDGSTLFVVADKAIDCKDYNEEGVEVTWETSTIRNWLNSSFYSTAFSSSEQGAIVTQNVVNEDNPYHNTEGGNNTSDNIYLLSISEVENETYGFCSDHSTYSVSRWVQPSNYASARGTHTHNDSSTDGNDNCGWWLRSPGVNSFQATDVTHYGRAGVDGVAFGRVGVCPALHINLSSGIWSMVNDGTSGEGGNGGGGNNHVQVPQARVTKLTIKAPSKKLAAEKKVKLTVDVTPSNAANKAVSWKTSNKKYATIDENGKLSLKKAGIGKTVTVTATAKDGSGKKATIKIKIMKHAVKSIKLKAPSKTLQAGRSMTVKATVSTTGKSVNKTLKWQSSNTKYATVNKTGKVTAKKAGKGKNVTITATSADGSNKNAKVKITIK